MLRAMGRMTGEALSIHERRMDSGFLELGMEVFVAGEADVGWLSDEKSFVRGFVAGVASDAVPGLERIVGDVPFRDFPGPGVAGLAFLPAPGTHQGLVLGAVGAVAGEAFRFLVCRMPVDPFLLLLDFVTADTGFLGTCGQEPPRALAVGVVACAAVTPPEHPMLMGVLEFLPGFIMAIHAEVDLWVLKEGREGRCMVPVAIHALAVPDRCVGGTGRFRLFVAATAEVVGRDRPLAPGMAGRALPVEDGLMNRPEEEMLGTRGMRIMAVEASRGRGNDSPMKLPHGGRTGPVTTLTQLMGFSAKQTGFVGPVGKVTPVAAVLGRPVEFLVLHLLRQGLMTDETQLALVPLQELR